MSDLLSVHDVTKVFGGVRAVDSASLSVREGTAADSVFSLQAIQPRL